MVGNESGRVCAVPSVARTACRKEVAEILEQAEQAARSWEIQYTHFHTPPVVQDALTAIEQLGDVAAVRWGGFPQAERCRIAVGREEVMLAAKDDPSQLADAVAALDCRGNFMFDQATHRDFLGAILGTGVVRDRVGVSHSCLSCHPQSA